MMLVKYKAMDTARLATVAAIADPDLQFPIEASSTYLVRGQIWMRGSTPGDIKVGFSAGGAALIHAAGANISWSAAQSDATKQLASSNPVPINVSSITAGTCRIIPCTTGSYRIPLKFVVLFQVGVIAGDFSIIWAQSVADVVNSAKMLEGSVLQYEKLP